MENDVKKFKEFLLNEELEETTKNMQDTAQVYSKYKNRVVNTIDSEDIQGSQEKFEKFLDSLPDNERDASDMLRTLFSSEMLKYAIEKLENDKKKIEEQIQNRMDELKNMQSNLK